MDGNINLFKQSWLTRKKTQRQFTIFLMITLLVFVFFYMIFLNKFSGFSLDDNFQSLRQEDKESLIQLRALVYGHSRRSQDTISLACWDKLITELLEGISQIESLTYLDKSWLIKGELKAYSDFQELTDRAANIRSQGIKVSVNKVGPLNQGQFILTLKEGE